MTIGYERQTGRTKYCVTIPYLLVIALVVGALAAYAGYSSKPSLSISTTTQTVQSVSIKSVTSTITSVVVTTPANPPSIIVYGSVTTSTFATSPAKLIIESGQGTVIQSIDLTTTSSHSYNITLANGGVYHFHVYWNITPIGSGDKICTTLQLTAGPGTNSIRLDLNC